MKKPRVQTASILIVALLSCTAFADFKAEFHLSPQWGGTSFTETNSGTFEHARSWDFFSNSGYSFGFKGAAQFSRISLGLSTEFGWKDEKINRRAQGSDAILSTYDFQLNRLLAGPFVSLHPSGGNFHLYLEYDPLVSSTVIYSDEQTDNPFRKNDTLIGSGYVVGIGFSGKDLLTRLIARRVIYSEIKTDGTTRTLPDVKYSQMTTTEFGFQFGFVL